MQYYGRLDRRRHEVMTVSLVDIRGRTLFKTDMNPE